MMTAILLWRPFSMLHGQLTAQKFRESCAVLLEQSLHVTNRNALARSDRLN